jgi:UDP-2,3-diacylglucosamine pyrophosphatase LpxH
MGKAAIFVSDMHWGCGDALEDFPPVNETAFEKFMKGMSGEFDREEGDLVLLGDTLDLWQVTTEKEQQAKNSEDIDYSVKPAAEVKRVKRIADAHKPTFPALAQFLRHDPSRRRIVCVPGNHDHALVHFTVRKTGIAALQDRRFP